MWSEGWRDRLWSQIDQLWDVLIVGGGITGAGILREAARAGLKTLLVERQDFAWGTSSRSSKLVHGGIRYLATGQFKLTLTSVREREQLLQTGPGLIEPLGFLIATYEGDRPGRLAYSAALAVYDLMASQWSHRHYGRDDFRIFAPHVVEKRLTGGFRYEDAQTDDARLVLRVIREAVADGGAALNYAGVDALLRDGGSVVGARVVDRVSGRSADVRARLVINATGAWADRLRGQVGAAPAIRPLRGSHLVFAGWRLPVAQALAFAHPVDRRPMFVAPWQGATLVGTTDVDHLDDADHEPRISPQETAYLMAGVVHQFPSLNLTLDDVVSTFAGVRPVIGTGKSDPSKESREHVVWDEAGLLTVTGGKLTTFRAIALDALHAASDRLPELRKLSGKEPVLKSVQLEPGIGQELDETSRRRLLGRYGTEAAQVIRAAQPGELTTIPGTETLWAELRWAARAEGVVHLDDLLLRRVRLGLLLPEGAAALLPRFRQICQAELGWDDARWELEEAAYQDLWHRHYSLPDRALIPDYRALLEKARQQNGQPSRWQRNYAVAVVFLCVLLGAVVMRARRRLERASASVLT